MENKKGQLDKQIVFIFLLVIVVVSLVLLIWAGATVIPLATGGISEVSSDIRGAVLTNEQGTSLGNATAEATRLTDNILGTVPFTIYALSLGLFIGYIAVCYYVRTLKFLAVIWLFVMVIVIVASMIVSDAYVLSASDGLTSDFYSQWGSNDSLMRNLPMIALVTTIVSGLFLFVLMSREPEEEDTAL